MNCTKYTMFTDNEFLVSQFETGELEQMDIQKINRYRARYEEEGFQEFIQELIDGRRLDEPSLGVAKQVVGRGIDSLSQKQRFVFERDVMDHFYILECDRCGENIPWEEMYQAEDTGLCSYCSHMQDKIMNE